MKTNQVTKIVLTALFAKNGFCGNIYYQNSYSRNKWICEHRRYDSFTKCMDDWWYIWWSGGQESVLHYQILVQDMECMYPGLL